MVSTSHQLCINPVPHHTFLPTCLKIVSCFAVGNCAITWSVALAIFTNGVVCWTAVYAWGLTWTAHGVLDATTSVSRATRCIRVLTAHDFMKSLGDVTIKLYSS